MRATYDRSEDTLWIVVNDDGPSAKDSEDVTSRSIVSLDEDRRVIASDLETARDHVEDLVLVAERYEIERELLEAAARAVIAAPDREVSVSFAAPSAV